MEAVRAARSRGQSERPGDWRQAAKTDSRKKIGARRFRECPGTAYRVTHQRDLTTFELRRLVFGLARGHVAAAGVGAAAVVSYQLPVVANNRIPTAFYAYFDANIPQARLGDPRSFVQ